MTRTAFGARDHLRSDSRLGNRPKSSIIESDLMNEAAAATARHVRSIVSQPEPTVDSRCTWRHAFRAALRARSLRRSVTAAAIVGTTLFTFNLAHEAFSKPVTLMLCIKAVVTYLVPWLNATFGIAIGVRDHSS